MAFSVSEPTEPAYVRSPVMVIRLLGSLALLGFMYLALQRAKDSHFATNLGNFLGGAPQWLVSGIVSSCQIGFLVPAILGFVGQLVLRRFARVGRLLLATGVCVAGLIAMQKLVGTSTLPLVPRRHGGVLPRSVGAVTGRGGYGIGAAFPTTLDLGVIASWMFVDRSHWSERWRRVGRLVLALGVAARLGVSLANPPRS